MVKRVLDRRGPERAVPALARLAAIGAAAPESTDADTPAVRAPLVQTAERRIPVLTAVPIATPPIAARAGPRSGHRTAALRSRAQRAARMRDGPAGTAGANRHASTTTSIRSSCRSSWRKARSSCRRSARRCAIGAITRPTRPPARRCNARCIRSRAARGWPVRCPSARCCTAMEARVENALGEPELPARLFDDLETEYDRIGTLFDALVSPVAACRGARYRSDLPRLARHQRRTPSRPAVRCLRARACRALARARRHDRPPGERGGRSLDRAQPDRRRDARAEERRCRS